MGIETVITVLFWVAAFTLAAGLVRRAALWRAGRPAPVQWSGVLAIPKRYFVDLHHVVARDPFIAHAHIATAGGAVAALGLVAINYGLMLYWPTLDWAILLAALAMLAGALCVWYRRRTPVTRLSRGPWDRLPYSLIAFALGLSILLLLQPGTVSSLIALAAVALLLWGGAELALGIGTGGPMKHAVAGLAHLAFHPRPERFNGGRSSGLKPLDLETGDFGIEKPADYKWNQLLGFDACVQCGKCEAACPAFASGQPLNPKKLVQDLVCGLTSSSDTHYAGSPYPGKPIGQHSGDLHGPIVPWLIEADTLWSCTTCRACVCECPMLIEHVDAIVGMRRHLNLVRGEAPGKAAETLANLRETETQGGYPLSKRFAWAADLNLTVARPGQHVDVILWAGDGAYDMRYQRTLRALVKILKAGSVDFAILGDAERDTGDTARRLGDEVTFQDLARRNIDTLKSMSFRRIITADPHVLHSLRNEYPSFGPAFEVQHHTALVSELMSSGRFGTLAASTSHSLTYHDPCYLGRYNGEFDAPRDILKRLGYDLREMQRSRRTSRCCGGGGGAPLTDIPGQQRIPDMRMADVCQTGASVVAVACPQCTAMLEGVTGERPEVLDIAELVANALEARS